MRKPRLMPITDEYTLLCETCGYTLDGLPHAGSCPECGRAIASSLPEARAGTPWDLGPSFKSWLLTGWMVVRTPRATFDQAVVNTDRLGRLFLFNTAVATAFALLPFWTGLYVNAWEKLDAHDGPRPTTVAFADAIVPFAGGVLTSGAVVFWLVAALTAIERRGLRVIGRFHRWRVTSATTAGVCSLASYGWILAGALVGVAAAAVYVMDELRWPSRATNLWLGPSLLASAALAGLLIFETLVYIGIRRCKFANRARPHTAPPSHGGPGAETLSAAPTQPRA